MIMWNTDGLVQLIASCIWNLSEWSGIGLGRLAPIVFHHVIYCESLYINKKEVHE